MYMVEKVHVQISTVVEQENAEGELKCRDSGSQGVFIPSVVNASPE